MFSKHGHLFDTLNGGHLFDTLKYKFWHCCVKIGAFTYLLMSHSAYCLVFIISPKWGRKAEDQAGKWAPSVILVLKFSVSGCFYFPWNISILTAALLQHIPSSPQVCQGLLDCFHAHLVPPVPPPLLLRAAAVGVERDGEVRHVWSGEEASRALLPAPLKSLHWTNRRSVSLMVPDVTPRTNPSPPLNLNYRRNYISIMCST